MKILEGVDLKPHTTVRIGGTAGLFFIPENTEELISVINDNLLRIIPRKKLLK